MKKSRVVFVSVLLLLYQIPYAQTSHSSQFFRSSNSRVVRDAGSYSELTIVNGKPASVSKNAGWSRFTRLMILNGYPGISRFDNSNSKLEYTIATDFTSKARLLQAPVYYSMNTRINGFPVADNDYPVIYPINAFPEFIKTASPSGMGTISTSVGLTSACIGSGFNIDYSSTNATFSPGNVFTAQLSDVSGSFSNAVNIGTFVSTSIMGTINVTIPSNTVPGSDYKIRVVSNDPVITGSSSSALILSSTNTWTGAVSTAWETAANWSCGLIPNANTDVIINSGSVVVSSNAVCKSLSVNPAVVFTVTTGFAIKVFQ